MLFTWWWLVSRSSAHWDEWKIVTLLSSWTYFCGWCRSLLWIGYALCTMEHLKGKDLSSEQARERELGVFFCGSIGKICHTPKEGHINHAVMRLAMRLLLLIPWSFSIPLDLPITQPICLSSMKKVWNLALSSIDYQSGSYSRQFLSSNVPAVIFPIRRAKSFLNESQNWEEPTHRSPYIFWIGRSFMPLDFYFPDH